MKRREFLKLPVAAALAAGLFGPVPAFARNDDAAQAMAKQLAREGWRNLKIGRTLLGRVRITANRDGRLREVVLDPRTGEVLRDLTQKVSASKPWDGGGSGGGTSASATDSDSDDGGDDGGGDDGGGDDD